MGAVCRRSGGQSSGVSHGRQRQPGARADRPLSRSYLILSMQIRAVTCRNVIQGKTTFWLHDLGRSGERAVRRRSLVIKELPRSTHRHAVCCVPSVESELRVRTDERRWDAVRTPHPFICAPHN